MVRRKQSAVTDLLEQIRSWTGVVLAVGAVIGTAWGAFQVIDMGSDAMMVAGEAKSKAEQLEERYNAHVEREWRQWKMQQQRVGTGPDRVGESGSREGRPADAQPPAAPRAGQAAK